MLGSTGLRYERQGLLNRLFLMADSARPFSRTYDAARQARVATTGFGVARRGGFSRHSGFAERVHDELASVGYAQLGALTFIAEDRPHRQRKRRSRWPWLLTAIVVAVFVDIVWLAYEEVYRIPPGSQAAQNGPTHSMINPPPKPLLKPLDLLMAEAAERE